MKKAKEKKDAKKTAGPEANTAAESLARMKEFTERKEKMIASIIASKN